ncbi:MAG: hypothetical protein JXB30_08235 [Anaerolineae bacterium]|nr:hypothetical protein [Anaerolineae bacterium]
MSLWIFLLIIFAAGAVGGIVNALLSDNGFVLPKPEKVGTSQIIRPGFLGNALISGVAACVSWGLYGPFAAVYIAGGAPQPSGETTSPGLTLSALVGAVLVGVAGARWLTNEVDKNLLRRAASEAAASQADTSMAQQIAVSTPVEALRLAQQK